MAYFLNWEPSLPRKRKASCRFEIYDGEGYHSLTVEEHYCTMYFEALDYAVSGIKERFDQPGYEIYKNLEGLLVKAEFQEVIALYGDDFDQSELATHLQIFGTNFSTCTTLQEAISFVQNLGQGQKLFLKQVCILVSLILVMPTTNAASERSFSVMRRLKIICRAQ